MTGFGLALISVIVAPLAIFAIMSVGLGRRFPKESVSTVRKRAFTCFLLSGAGILILTFLVIEGVINETTLMGGTLGWLLLVGLLVHKTMPYKEVEN